jgi:hypothetical protein
MDALVFASHVPTVKGMKIIEEIFDVYRQHFADCDIYIGINGNTCPEYIEYLERLKSELNIKYAITPEELEVKSDASAFQTALKLMKDSGFKYNLIWFGHTKGMVNGTHSWRHIFIKEFFSDRVHITKLLNNSDAGTYSLYLSKHKGCEYFTNVLENYFKFDRKNFFSYLYLFTFYVIKGEYVYNFLHKCDESFYTTKIEDIYLFERDFPQIAWRQGGYPLYKYWDTHLVSLGGHPETHYKLDLENYL